MSKSSSRKARVFFCTFVNFFHQLWADGLKVGTLHPHQVDEAGIAIHLCPNKQRLKFVKKTFFFWSNAHSIHPKLKPPVDFSPPRNFNDERVSGRINALLVSSNFHLSPIQRTRHPPHPNPLSEGEKRHRIARLRRQKTKTRKRRWILYLTGSSIKNVGDKRRE